MGSLLNEVTSYPAMGTLLVGILTFALANLLMKRKTFRPNLPPGPTKLPIIGTLLFHGFSSKDFTRLSEKYGNIFTIYIGNVRCVILNSYDLMKEALVTKSQQFSGRGYGLMLLKSNPHKLGILDAEYTPEMRQHRNLALSIFRTLGFGKPMMESKILEEAEILVQEFQAENGNEFNPTHFVTVSVANVINSVMFNKRYEHRDDSLAEVIGRSNDFMKAGEKVLLAGFFPRLCWLPSIKKAALDYVKANQGMMDFVWNDLQEHRESHTSGLDSDFTHTFIDKHVNVETNESSLDVANLHYMLRDFFLAGMETTTTSTNWLILLMANHPEIQEKAHKEIDRVVGKDRPVRIADRDYLHFTEAIIWEVQRIKTIAPLSILHYTESGGTLAGYDIPQGTPIIQNLARVHNNPETWNEPEIFRPERFLNADGRFVRHPHLIPFSTGKRQCLGEVLARQELFLFAAALLQKFTFLPPDGVNKLDEEGIEGFTYLPKAFRIRATLR